MTKKKNALSSNLIKFTLTRGVWPRTPGKDSPRFNLVQPGWLLIHITDQLCLEFDWEPESFIAKFLPKFIEPAPRKVIPFVSQPRPQDGKQDTEDGSKAA